MKNLFFALAAGALIGWSNVQAQVKQINDAPLYEFGGQSAKGIACFSDENIQDSLKVYFKVDVLFRDALQKDVKPIVETVRVREMKAVNLSKAVGQKEFCLISDGAKRCKKHSDLWDRYTPFITTWYEDLPYEVMKKSDYYGLKKITFNGVFVMVPQK